MKLLILVFLFLLTGCIVKKEAVLVGYKRDAVILVSSDTIEYRSNNKGLLGDRYRVLYRGNRPIRVQKIKKLL